MSLKQPVAPQGDIQCACPILDASAWREYRGKPANSGINANTHIAKVADTTGKLRDCFVKLLPTDSPALLCEAIGWLLARESDLSHPAGR